MEVRIPVFSENSRVCFLGDSLTAGGLWVEILFEFYQRRFPGRNIRIYNAGTGGGTIHFAMNYLEQDILAMRPTHVVIMYCANDMNRYKGPYLQRALQFLEDIRRITNYFQERGITVYYGIEPKCQAEDQSTFTARDAGWAAFKSAAEEYHIPYFDLYTMMSPLIFQQEGIVGEDLVHFTALGESVVAKLFLYSQGFEEFSPEREDFLQEIQLSDLGRRRWEICNKIRRVWMAEANVLLAVVGAPVEKKMARLKERIPTRANGQWDDFCYDRAIDYIQLRPHLEEYLAQLEAVTEEMMA